MAKPLGLLVDVIIHSEQKVAQCKINNLRKLTVSTGYPLWVEKNHDLP